MTKKTIQEIRKDFGESYDYSKDAMLTCKESIRFANQYGAQWDGAPQSDTLKPEINKVGMKVQRLVGQMSRLNFGAEIFPSSNEASKKDAQNLQNLWRTDSTKGQGLEAQNNARSEAIAGGFGAMKMVTKFSNEEQPNVDDQTIELEPMYMACESIIFGKESNRKDKSDCKQVWQLDSGNSTALKEEFGLESISSFGSYRDDSINTNTTRNNDETVKDVVLAHYYEVMEEKIKTVLINGIEFTRVGSKKYYESEQFDIKITQAEINSIRDALENGEVDFDSIGQIYSLEYMPDRKSTYVSYSLLSGEDFLIKNHRMPFKRQPIIPVYGYYYRQEGVENFFGIVQYMKDPQRYLNFVYAGMMELLDQPQDATPVLTNEQLETTAQYWFDRKTKRYPVLPIDTKKAPDGTTLPTDPIQFIQPPQISPALGAALEGMETAVAELGGSGQTTLPANTSGDAVRLINERQDDVYYPLTASYMQAMTNAVETYIPAAQKLYFSKPMSLTVTMVDGSRGELMTMTQQQLGEGLGQDNTASGSYAVEIKVDEGYKSNQEQQERNIIEKMQAIGDPQSPEYKILQLALIQTGSGEATELSRKIARNQEIQMALANGIEVEPRDDEEAQKIAMMQQQIMQAQQNPPEDPAMTLAIAEQEKAVAEQMKVQQQMQADAMAHEAKMIELSIKQQSNQVEAAKVGAQIQNINIDTQSKQLDNLIKLNSPLN